MTKTFVLLVLIVLAAVAGTYARGQATRQVGGFVAQVPGDQTPQTAQKTEPLPPGYRRVAHGPGTTIYSLLQKDDKVLELTLDGSNTLDGNADADVEIQQITQFADAVVVLRVTAKQGAITDDGALIDSTITANIEEVLKDATGKLATGTALSFKALGGSVMVGTQRVIVTYKAWRQTEVGATYLAALGYSTQTDSFRLYPSQSFEVKGSSLVRMRTNAPPTWVLDKQSIDWAKERVKKNAHLRRPQR